MSKNLLLIACFFVFQGLASAQDPCSEEVAYQWLDFWVGEWIVEDNNGQEIGKSSVRKILNGCAIEEHWENTRGRCARSFFFIDYDRARWELVTVTEQANQPGGQKNRHFIERKDDGTVIFEGSYMVKLDRRVDRLVLTPLEKGEVRKEVLISKDRGQSWEVVFSGIFRRK